MKIKRISLAVGIVGLSVVIAILALIVAGTLGYGNKDVGMNLDGVKRFSAEDNEPMLIRIDDPILLDFKHAVNNEADNLAQVTVSYDNEGSSTVEGVVIEVNPKNSKELMIKPPVGGWFTNVDYFLVVNEALKINTDQSYGKKMIRPFKVDSASFHKVTGKLSFPKDLVAPNDARFFVSMTNLQDKDIYKEQRIVFEKGKPYATYELLVPESRFGYAIGYQLIYGETHIFDFYYDHAWTGNRGTVQTFEEVRKIAFDKNHVENIEIAENKEVCDEIRKIRKEVFQPGMTDYEKIESLYDYVQNHMMYDVSVYNPYKDNPKGEIYTGNLLSQVILDKNAVCAGFANGMDYILTLEGIETDIRRAKILRNYKPLTHAWNVVKIDGEYYNVDLTASSSKSEMSRIKDWFKSEILFNDQNYGDSITLIYGEQYKCNAVKYATSFYDYWKVHPELSNKMTEVKGTVVLPKGEVAPEGGILVSVGAFIGIDTQKTSDDFNSGTKIWIPEGQREAEYTFTAVQTNEPLIVLAYTKKYGTDEKLERVFMSQEIDLSTHQKSTVIVPQIQLEEAEYMSGTVNLQDKDTLADEDLLIIVIAENDDGTQDFEMYGDIYMDGACIAKGKTSDTFTLAVQKSEKPYILSYEIMNRKEVKAYEELGYLSSNGSTVDYGKALKLDSKAIQKPLQINLIPRSKN